MSHDIDVIGERLRRAGYRLTPQRQFILDAICRLGGHVSAEAIYQAVQPIAPTLNLATVYRNLQFLADNNLLTVTHAGGGKLKYELADAELHHHLLCSDCGRSIEIGHDALAPLYERMQAEHSFQIGMRHITFLGTCAACQPQTVNP